MRLAFLIVLAVLYIGVPLLILWASRRYGWVDKIGAVTLSYAAGILLGNLPGVTIEEPMVSAPMYVLVLLSIPLLLFSSDFTVWRRMGMVLALSFFLCVLSVTVAVILGTWLFKDRIEDAWALNSMLMGVYTGGTPNLAAIGLSLGVDEADFVVVNGAEMLFGGIWLLGLLTIARPVFAKLLPRRRAIQESTVQYTVDEIMEWRSSTLGCLCALLVAGISVGLAFLFFDPASTVFSTAVFLLVTTLGIGAAAIPFVRNLKGSFGLGNYFLLVFCMIVGSLADVGKIFGTATVILELVACVMFCTILLHFLLCRIFRIDSETFIIASSAGIYGPPFIAPIARAIGNPSLIPIGLALGVLGLAVGNYCGISISHLLRLI